MNKKQTPLRQKLAGTTASVISVTDDKLNMSYSSTAGSENKATAENHMSPELPLKTKELLVWKASQSAANNVISVGGSSQKLKVCFYVFLCCVHCISINYHAIQVPRKVGPDFRSPTVKKYEEYMHKLEEQVIHKFYNRSPFLKLIKLLIGQNERK